MRGRFLFRRPCLWEVFLTGVCLSVAPSYASGLDPWDVSGLGDPARSSKPDGRIRLEQTPSMTPVELGTVLEDPTAEEVSLTSTLYHGDLGDPMDTRSSKPSGFLQTRVDF
jgi:hypothetical protein